MTTLRNAQTVVETLLAGTPKATLAQEAVEVLLSTNPNLANSQIAVEVLLDPGGVNIDCTQFVAEILCILPQNTGSPAGILLAN